MSGPRLMFNSAVVFFAGYGFGTLLIDIARLI